MQEEEAWVLDRKQMIINHRRRERQLKEHYFFHIEALESALTETKVRCRREVEQVEMQMNDLESQYMNLEYRGKFKKIEGFILEQHEFIKKLGIHNLKEFQSPFQMLR